MGNTETFRVRPAEPADVPQLLQLMRALARFEGYIDQFAVTEDALMTAGFSKDQPLFRCFVAIGDRDARLHGMAVTYVIPWTYDLTPTIVLKELFVTDDSRKSGIGLLLMKAVAHHAVTMGAKRLQWSVLPKNDVAKSFYAALGGNPDMQWEPWIMDADAIALLGKFTTAVSPVQCVHEGDGVAHIQSDNEAASKADFRNK
ncbi:MAG: GNAT family N-acetyltransferase [Parvularculaceae bacterium]